MSKIYTFSPSEFAFNYAGCKRCYYDQKVHNIKVSLPFPSIFSKLDILQKNYYHNKPSALISKNLEEGTIKTDYAKTQKSKIFEDEKGRKYYLNGRIDAYVKHKDFYSIIDFKVTDINQKKIDTYSTQLLAYALMFEYPGENSEKFTPVKNLGIFCFEPDTIIEHNHEPNFKMRTQYYPIQRNDQKMFSFMTEVIDLLEGKPPASDPKCTVCKVRNLI